MRVLRTRPRFSTAALGAVLVTTLMLTSLTPTTDAEAATPQISVGSVSENICDNPDNDPVIACDVRHMFIFTLGRTDMTDPQTLSHFSAMGSLAEVRRTLAYSTEAADKIRSYFRSCFGRDVGATDVRAWQDALNNKSWRNAAGPSSMADMATFAAGAAGANCSVALLKALPVPHEASVLCPDSSDPVTACDVHRQFLFTLGRPEPVDAQAVAHFSAMGSVAEVRRTLAFSTEAADKIRSYFTSCFNRGIGAADLRAWQEALNSNSWRNASGPSSMADMAVFAANAAGASCTAIRVDEYAPIGDGDYPPTGSTEYAPVGPGDFMPMGSADWAPPGDADAAPPGSGTYVPRRSPSLPHEPYGVLEVATITADGRLHLRGWARDPDYGGTVKVTVLTNGKYRATVEADQTLTVQSYAGAHSFNWVSPDPASELLTQQGLTALQVWIDNVDDRGRPQGNLERAPEVGGSPRWITCSSGNMCAFGDQRPPMPPAPTGAASPAFLSWLDSEFFNRPVRVDGVNVDVIDNSILAGHTIGFGGSSVFASPNVYASAGAIVNIAQLPGPSLPTLINAPAAEMAGDTIIRLTTGAYNRIPAPIRACVAAGAIAYGFLRVGKLYRWHRVGRPVTTTENVEGGAGAGAACAGAIAIPLTQQDIP